MFLSIQVAELLNSVMQNHKLKISFFALLISCSLSGMLSGCSTPTSLTVQTYGNTETFYGVQEMGTPVKQDLSKNPDNKKLRYQAIQETALSTGAQSGLAWESKNIDAQLETHAETLDKIYAFNALVLDHNVLPPVLLEGRNILNISDPNTIRIADRRYKIAKQARFVTAAPTWRQYLWMDYAVPDRPNQSFLPEDAYEQKIWEYYVAIGWAEGVKQAGNIFSNNVARLYEDFNGMILYRKLLAQNMVSPPYVAQTELGITGDQAEINIDDQVLRITALPQLNPDSSGWNPVVAQNKEDLKRYKKMEQMVQAHPLVSTQNQTLPSDGWQPVISNMSANE